MRDPDEWPDIAFHATRVTKAARHDHRCSACPDPILRGQPFSRAVAKVDGVLATSRVHHPFCARDLREAELQAALDQELFNPTAPAA